MGSFDRNDQKKANPEQSVTDAILQAPVESTPDDAPPRVDGAKVEPRRPRHIGEIAREAREVMFARASGKEHPIPTPWGSVDAVLRGGFWPGLYTLTSATGFGKTQWAIQASVRAAAFMEKHLPGKRVVYVALELGGVDLTARILSSLHAQIPGQHEPSPRWSDLFLGRRRLGERESVPVDAVVHGNEVLIPEVVNNTFEAFDGVLSTLPFYVETAPIRGFTYEHLEAIGAPDVRLIVLDYTQLVRSPEPREELRETIGRVATTARQIARDHGATVLALSSTARANYEKVKQGAEGEAAEPAWMNDPGSLVGLGKESGEIEFTGDVIMSLARHKSATYLVVSKGRFSGPDKVPLAFDGTLFSECDDTAPPREETRPPQHEQRSKATANGRRNGAETISRWTEDD